MSLHLRDPLHPKVACLPAVWAECPPAWEIINFLFHSLFFKRIKNLWDTPFYIIQFSRPCPSCRRTQRLDSDRFFVFPNVLNSPPRIFTKNFSPRADTPSPSSYQDPSSCFGVLSRSSSGTIRSSEHISHTFTWSGSIFFRYW